MDRLWWNSWASMAVAMLATVGCMSPYHTDRGALAGGLTGAGAGALIGSATGNAGAGAAIGAGLGTLTGAMIGSEMDQMEARNRAMIEQKLGHQVAAGSVTVNDVLSMAHGGVSEDLICNHVEYHGMVAPLTSNDLILLKQQGISDRIVKSMQTPPKHMVGQPVAVAQPVPQPVVVQEYYDPWAPRPVMVYGPPPCYRYPPPPPPPSVSWGVSIRN